MSEEHLFSETFRIHCCFISGTLVTSARGRLCSVGRFGVGVGAGGWWGGQAVLVDSDGRDVLVDQQGQLEGVPAHLEVDRPRDGGWCGDEWERRRRVMSWAGPWPVDEGWWRPEGASRRAYLQVVADPGPPLLLVRAGRWWLDAVYG